MSRVVRTKKKEPQDGTLNSDNKKILVKKATPSRALKASTNLNESSIPVADEKERNKKRPSNAANITLNSTKEGVYKLQHPERKSVNPQPNKSVSRKVSSTSQQQKHVPLRAKQLPTTSKAIRATSQRNNSPATTYKKIDKTPIYKKQNPALDTPHNVTVCSPPPKKKNDYYKAISNDDRKSNDSKIVRKGSRTLAPDEIVILKREPGEKKTEEIKAKDTLQVEDAHKLPVRISQPVAFEVQFKDKAVKERPISREKFDAIDRTDKNNEELHYSDDFESYESDFETDSSTHSVASSSDSSSLLSKNISEILVDERDELTNPDDSFNQLSSDGGANGHDDSELAQSKILEIVKDKERKLDSGHYDMNSRNINVIKSSDMSVQFTHHIITNSLDTFSLGTSDQMDSGISTSATSIPATTFNKNNIEIVYGGYKDFYANPFINGRGSELMTKIQFDVLSFTLVDLKPISYDIFMQTFGKLNTNQNFTQTDGNQMQVEQQTEVQETRSIWTQHPPQFKFEISKHLNENRIFNQHFCGDIIDEHQSQFVSHCELEQSLNAIKRLNNERSKREYQKQQRTTINYEHLNSFLLRSALLIDQILGSSTTNTKNKPQTQNSLGEHDQVLKRLCEKSFYMETNLLNTLRVLKIFSNNKYNLLITVHESLPDTNVYNSDFTNLLMVWCTNTCDKPMRLLTTWSQVSKIEISNDSSDIIVAALRDGSIALWDLRETHSFCSKLDGYLTHFAATQSIIPSWYGEKTNSKSIMDLGACLDVKSFRSQTNNMLTETTFPQTQFVSLHDSGFITVWTLVETSEIAVNVSQTKISETHKYSSNIKETFEYTSPWARVKLMQSALANIKEHLEKKSHHSQSRFDKTKTLFQKNIYSDEALKELHEYTSELGQQGIRFSSLECGSENLFICTNRNFILMCSKTLKMEKLKRITINESHFLFPTALKVLSNEHFLAVGLSNGEVMILNCQSHNLTEAHKKTKKSIGTRDTVGTKSDSPFDDNNTRTITGKSCTIQNILLNVEKSYGDMDFGREYRPSTAACITLIESKKKPFEIRVLEQQVIMSGSVLRRNLIQSLDLSSDGWYLFALANGHMRIYDFYLDQEVSQEGSQEAGRIIAMAAGKCGSRENNLMILRRNAEVEVYILNK